MAGSKESPERRTEVAQSRLTQVFKFLKALNELALGSCDEAKATATKLKVAQETDHGQYFHLRERLSSQRLSRLDDLLESI